MESIINEQLTWNEFTRVEMRIGTIVSAEVFQEVRNPAYKLVIDFGELGERKTSAQITKLYTTAELIGKQIIAVVNYPAKQIANMMSECLVLGLVGKEDVVLITPDRKVKNGMRLA
jgi:tRNA-binding protein